MKQSDVFEVRDKSGKSLFEKMMTSNSDKDAKFISLVIKYYNLGSDEEFLLKTTAAGKTWMELVAETKSDEIFFSFLMFDWFHPESRKVDNYCLVMKARQYFESTDKFLINRLIEIIREKDTKVFYKEVAVKIVYQLIYETSAAENELRELYIKIRSVENDEKKKEELWKKHDEKKINLNSITSDQKISCILEAFKIEKQEYREQLLQVLIVFWIDTNSEKYEEFKEKTTNLKNMLNASTESNEVAITSKASDELSPAAKSFFNLVYLLKEQKTVEFERVFEDWIRKARKGCIDDFQISLKPAIRLLSKITEVKNLHKATEFIFQKYPYIGINSSIMTSFNDVEDFKKFYVHKPKEIKQLVSSNLL